MNEMTNSHILMGQFDYYEPASIEEAISLLQKYGEHARLLAGGTDLLVQMKMERIAPSHLISLGAIQDMEYIITRQDGLEIGARTSIRAIAHNATVRSFFPALAEACESFSTTQTQIMGTLGGNLCNASPASDSAPALIVQKANAIIEGLGGIRSIPVENFFLNPGVSALKRGELLRAVLLPWPVSKSGEAFLKISRVAADIAKVNVAAILERDGERVRSCRLAFGSVAPTPRRAKRSEAILEGKRFTQKLIAEAAQTAVAEMVPIDDVRSGDGTFSIICEVNDLPAVKDVATEAGFTVEESEMEWMPKDYVSIDEESIEAKAYKFLEGIEEVDDVQNVYTNLG